MQIRLSDTPKGLLGVYWGYPGGSLLKDRLFSYGSLGFKKGTDCHLADARPRRDIRQTMLQDKTVPGDPQDTPRYPSRTPPDTTLRCS